MSNEFLVNKKPHKAAILERNGNTFLVEINGKTVMVKLKNPNQGRTAIMEINGRSFKTRIEKNQRSTLQIRIGEKAFEVQRQFETLKKTSEKLEPVAAIAKKPVTSFRIEKDAVVAPISGRIVLLKADVGQKVGKGECICILEAMKMENEIAAPKAGVVKEVRISKGAVVNRGDVLAVIT